MRFRFKNREKWKTNFDVISHNSIQKTKHRRFEGGFADHEMNSDLVAHEIIQWREAAKKKGISKQNSQKHLPHPFRDSEPASLGVGSQGKKIFS